MHICFRREICKSLEVKADYLLITDQNHYVKRFCYQLIGGSVLPVAGIHVIDTQMLQVAVISKDIWLPKNFSYDLLVLKLASSETVKKLTDIIMIGEDTAAVGSLCTSFHSICSILFLLISFITKE